MVLEFPGLSYQNLDHLTDLDTILITNTHTVLKNLPAGLLKRTKLIIHPNSGYDHFESEHELWKNIPIVVGHTIRAQAVAEYTLACVFEGLTELPQHISWNKDRTWNRTLLKGTSVWIFGYGHIGKIVANTLAAIGMEITIVDPFISSCPYKLFQSYNDGNVKEAKVVIAATSLNHTSKKLFNDNFFSSLRNDVLFINGARGKLVDEKALKEYLLKSPKAFAFLDVFENEPFGEEWIGFPQVWRTSHIAGVERNLDQKLIQFERKVIADFLESDTLQFETKYAKELLQKKWIKGVLV